MGWGDVRHCFAMAILAIIIILLLSFFLPTHFSATTERKSNEVNLITRLGVIALFSLFLF
jgi:hypothetical protein